MLLEIPSQIGLAGKVQVVRYLLHGHFRGTQQHLCLQYDMPVYNGLRLPPFTNSSETASVKALIAFSASFLEISAFSATAAINSVLFIDLFLLLLLILSFYLP